MHRWGPQESQNASSSLVEPFHQALEVHLKRGGYKLACSVDLQLCKCVLRLEACCHWWDGLTRKTTHYMQSVGFRKHKMPAVLISGAIPPGPGGQCTFKEEDALAVFISMQLC